MPESKRRKQKPPRHLSAVAAHDLTVFADCCTVKVTFTGNRADSAHSATCTAPDHHGVARIIAQAVADLHGERVIAVY